MAGARLVAPHVMTVEAANIIRRMGASSQIPWEQADAAFGMLVSLPFELAFFSGLAERIWQLRHTVTCYDAWYVALAESLNAPLATLDLRLARASGPRCRFLTPPATAGDAPA